MKIAREAEKNSKNLQKPPRLHHEGAFDCKVYDLRQFNGAFILLAQLPFAGLLEEWLLPSSQLLPGSNRRLSLASCQQVC